MPFTGFTVCLTCGATERSGDKRNAPNGYCSRQCAFTAPSPPWCPTLAYLAGIVASDGCMEDDGQFSVTSTNENIIRTVMELLSKLSITGHEGLNGCERYTISGKPYWKVRWRHSPMYSCFLRIGITPRKSKTMAALELPVDGYGYNYFWMFLRGLIDGDGSIPRHKKGNLMSIRIVSAAPLFIRWVKDELYKRGVYDVLLFQSSSKQTAEILQIRVQYIPLFYHKMYITYPAFAGYGHLPKRDRLASRNNNLAARSKIRDNKIALINDIETAMMVCYQRLQRWPKLCEYKEIRIEGNKVLENTRSFPHPSSIQRNFSKWDMLITHMTQRYPALHKS